MIEGREKVDGRARVTFSPGEFAALFGKSQTWGYRQIYAGRVKAITEYGRILIPAKEVERILGSAEEYTGLKKSLASKTLAKKLKPKFESAWKNFLKVRRAGNTKAGDGLEEEKRAAAIGRLARGKGL